MNEMKMNEMTENIEVTKENASGMTYLDRKDIGIFTRRLSGKTDDGESKVVVSYQTYAMEDPEESVDKERVYTTDKPHIELSIDMKYPQFYVMDIIFRSYDDPELKLLWGRLQRFKKNMTNDPEKTWIFYFNILEKASVTQQTSEQDSLFIANIFNPTIFYLSREIPDMLAVDTEGNDGNLHGGNVIRMLIPIEFVTFQIENSIDTTEIKGEVMREEEARSYLDNPENHSNWEE